MGMLVCSEAVAVVACSADGRAGDVAAPCVTVEGFGAAKVGFGAAFDVDAAYDEGCAVFAAVVVLEATVDVLDPADLGIVVFVATVLGVALAALLAPADEATLAVVLVAVVVFFVVGV